MWISSRHKVRLPLVPPVQTLCIGLGFCLRTSPNLPLILLISSWALKILTDPFTDLLDFYTHMFIHPRWFLDLKDQRALYRLNIKTKEVVKVE